MTELNAAGDVRLGATAVDALYLGGALVWSPPPPPGDPVYLSDAFVRPAGVTELGADWVLSGTGASALYVNEAAQRVQFTTSSTATGIGMHAKALASSDHYVQALLTAGGTGSGNRRSQVRARFADPLAVGGYGARLARLSGVMSWDLYRENADATLTQLATGGDVTGTALVRLECQGATLRVIVDGTLRATVTDATYAGTRTGFAIQDNGPNRTFVDTWEAGVL